MLKKSFVLVLLVMWAGCTTAPQSAAPQITPEESVDLTLEMIKQGIAFDKYLEAGSEWQTIGDTCEAVSEVVFFETHPDQLTECYSIGDLSLATVSEPNAWTALSEVRAWEEQGYEAWSGVLVKHIKGDWRPFLTIKDDFNPVALYLTEESLVLEAADDSGAGSGEGTLIRYVYPFAGVEDELLYEWTQEKCEGYYVPETYGPGEGCEVE